jgi:hypothetical protein
MPDETGKARYAYEASLAFKVRDPAERICTFCCPTMMQNKHSQLWKWKLKKSKADTKICKTPYTDQRISANVSQPRLRLSTHFSLLEVTPIPEYKDEFRLRLNNSFHSSLTLSSFKRISKSSPCRFSCNLSASLSLPSSFRRDRHLVSIAEVLEYVPWQHSLLVPKTRVQQSSKASEMLSTAPPSPTVPHIAMASTLFVLEAICQSQSQSLPKTLPCQLPWEEVFQSVESVHFCRTCLWERL